MKKKIKAIILVNWFILAIISGIILCLNFKGIEVLVILNICFPFIFIISDNELINMRLGDDK